MTGQPGLRERKKAQQRERIADVAAGLFAEHGYDTVLMVDVARAADVSEQTVYNYFPAKHELVLDLADQLLELYSRVVLERPGGTSPANALRPVVEEDIDRFRHQDPKLALGQFPTQCLRSGVLRRFALELRDQQADTVSAAIAKSCPGIPAIVVRAHAAALISVIQTITDQIGAHVLNNSPRDPAAADMRQAMHLAFDDLDRTFQSITNAAPTGRPT